jgi:hypothetical protein
VTLLQSRLFDHWPLFLQKAVDAFRFVWVPDLTSPPASRKFGFMDIFRQRIDVMPAVA